MQLSFSPAHSRKMSGRECVRSLWMFVLLHLSIQTELFTAHKHDPICFSCVVFSLSLFAFYRTLLYSSVCIALRSVPFYFPLGAFNCMHFHDICMYLSARQWERERESERVCVRWKLVCRHKWMKLCKIYAYIFDIYGQCDSCAVQFSLIRGFCFCFCYICCAV